MLVECGRKVRCEVCFTGYWSEVKLSFDPRRGQEEGGVLRTSRRCKRPNKSRKRAQGK